MSRVKKQECMTHALDKEQTTESTCETNQMLDLTAFKIAITNMFKGLKETVIKE